MNQSLHSHYILKIFVACFATKMLFFFFLIFRSSDDARNCDSIEEDEEGESMFIHGSKVANFLKGWFSYRKFRNSIV